MVMTRKEIYKKIKDSKYGEKVELHIKSSDLHKGFKLPSKSLDLVFIVYNILSITLEIDPNDLEAQDDKYILFSTDKKCSYYKELTIKDDKIEGDKKITLEYDDIIKDLNYSLKIDLGKGNFYFLFENMKYSDLKNIMGWI